MIIAASLSLQLTRLGYEVSGIVSRAEEIYSSITKQNNEYIELIKQCEKKYIEIQNEKLNRMMKELDDYSKKDPLTGLANRRSMIAALENEKMLFDKNNKQFVIVMADVDYFKKVNDTLGHDYGDYVLKALSEIFHSSLRKSDMVSRWGGEEFLFMLTGIEAIDAVTVVEKIRKAISEHVFEFNGIKKSITMTFGISQYSMGNTIDDVIKRADNALFEGKNAGRNVVVLA